MKEEEFFFSQMVWGKSKKRVLRAELFLRGPSRKSSLKKPFGAKKKSLLCSGSYRHLRTIYLTIYLPYTFYSPFLPLLCHTAIKRKNSLLTSLLYCLHCRCGGASVTDNGSDLNLAHFFNQILKGSCTLFKLEG